MSLRVGVIGATGYTGFELVKILVRHPEVTLTLVTSEKFAGKTLDQAFPALQGISKLELKPLNDDEVIAHCDLAFSCLPHHEAMSHVAKWHKAGLRVIDLSADFRLKSQKIYEEWYGVHEAADLLSKAVYGLPELFRSEIKKAQLIANPGCYPTSATLALLPLLKNKLIDTKSIIIDSKSGTSGAGRNAKLDTLFCEVNESLHAYSVAKHRHMPEIEQNLSGIAGEDILVSFVPHLIPMDRGILTTVYANLLNQASAEKLHQIFESIYKDELFVQVRPLGVMPKTKEVSGTNNCALGVAVDLRTNRVIIVSVIDNLLKGASSQAVQNMNIMCGFNESLGLSL